MEWAGGLCTTGAPTEDTVIALRGGINRGEDFVEADRFRRLGEGESTSMPTLRSEQAGGNEPAQNLR